MTSPFQNPIFDSETTAFLTELRDSILGHLPLEKLPPDACREVRLRLEQALADLARAGQRDPGQLERYARAQISPLIAAKNSTSGAGR
jgi:hypothetical protein